MGKVLIPGTYEASLGASMALDVMERYVHEEFRNTPDAHAVDGYGDPTGTGGDENHLHTDRNYFEYHILGTQTILIPAWVAASGLNIAMDQAADDGVEITGGIGVRSRQRYVVGTDQFYAKCTLTLADVSGSDDLAFGFRKMEAYQANIDDYDEMAALNIISGAIYSETILNGGTTASVDTTETNTATVAVTLEARVDLAGVVTFLIDGVVPGTVGAFTFDAAEAVIPFLFFLNDTDLMDTLYVTLWECGLWAARGLESGTDTVN